MKQRVRDLIEQGDRLFSKRTGVLNLWQELALNFNPIRADFTSPFVPGEEFASHLMTSRPLLSQRDLGNALSAMLRERGSVWFRPRTDDEAVNEDAAARQWLDHKGDVMRRVMYDNRSGFVRATKQGDADFTLLGQAVITPEPNRNHTGILYRCWHLRDVAWCENAELQIDEVHRTWLLEARNFRSVFRNPSPRIDDVVKNSPYREIKCRHIVIPSDAYDLSIEGRPVNKQRFPFVSIYVDCEHEHILEEVPRKRLGYVIPRWLTVPGSQYAHSPAAVAALPEARLLQAINLTLLEAGEKAIDPPMIASQAGISGAVNLYRGGITWVDEEFDERQSGAALRPAMKAPEGLTFGKDRETSISEIIAEAFYLNKITLPDLSEGDMTAYEVGKRIEEYRRSALPLFEPMEVEYNGGLCEETFQVCMDLNLFGPLDDMPRILSRREIRWQFESPLQAATERAKSQAFMESMQLLKIAAEADPSARHVLNVQAGFREALTGARAPAKWIATEEEVAQAAAAERQAAAMQSAVASIGQMGAIAEQVGAGAKALNDAGMVGQ